MTNTLQADTAFVIHLRSYAFFHSGRERLVNRVLKRVWDHIPGGTLYGAVAAALIRLDGAEDADIAGNTSAFTEGQRGYYRLLRAVQEQQVRFTPLLPSPDGTAITTAQDYCAQALRLHAALHGTAADAATGTSPTDRERQLLHTTPHAPLGRATEKIHGSDLFVLRTHRPFLDYYGFIFAQAALKPDLERAFRLFPFMPMGGRGKYSLTEAKILEAVGMATFKADLETWLAQKPASWVRLVTPLVLNGGGETDLLAGAEREMVLPGLRRYRVWRTGRYYATQTKTFEPLGFRPPAAVDYLQGGAESQAVLAVPERSRFGLADGETVQDIARWFIDGVGNPSWTYLGWGQVVVE